MTWSDLVSIEPRYTYPAKITIKHPQLRDLIHSPLNNQVFYVHNRSIIRHHLDVPAGKPKVFSQLSYPPVTLSTGYGMLATAGSSGEVTVHSLDNSSSDNIFDARIGSSINNHISFAPQPTSSIEPRLLVCSNDAIIRVFKVGCRCTPQLDQVSTLKFNTAINQASISPSSRILIAVGDTPEVHLFDCSPSGSFNRMHTLNSASDAGFSTAWSSDGLKFAVASQDGMCTVWDIRSTKPLEKFTTHSNSPSRAVKFTSSSSSKELMVFTENSNRVHVVDALTFSPSTKQTIDIPSSTTNLPTPPFYSPRSHSPPLLYNSNDEESSPEIFTSFFPNNINPTRSLRHLFNNSYTNLDRISPSVLSRELRSTFNDLDIAGVDFSPDGSRLYIGSEKSLTDWDVNGATTKLFESGEFL